MIWIARVLGLGNAASGLVLGAIVIGVIARGSDVSNWVVVATGVMAVLSLLAFGATIRPYPALVFCQVLTAALFTLAALPTALSIGGLLLLVGLVTFLALMFTLPEIVKRERHTGEYWREHFRPVRRHETTP